ncbi:MAG: conjugal transfer protein MobA [Bacteroides ovatus]
MDELQNIEFERLFENSGAKNKSQFILSALFDKPMKVVKIDKAATDYYIKLTNLQSEYRRIGVNYNQAVKALHTGLSEKKALAMLYKLEQLTIELISLNREIIRLTQEFEQWLQK